MEKPGSDCWEQWSCCSGPVLSAHVGSRWRSEWRDASQPHSGGKAAPLRREQREDAARVSVWVLGGGTRGSVMQVPDFGPRYSLALVCRRQRDGHVLVTMVSCSAEDAAGLDEGLVAGCGCVSFRAFFECRTAIIIRNLIKFYICKFSLRHLSFTLY